MQTPFSFMRRACILSLFVLLPALAAAATDQPNVILITLDTVRADRMGFLGSKLGLTPHLDALAGQSVVFERAYSQAPITPVSHATILTGTYPQYHGIRNFGDRLPPSVPFLPEILHAQGYHTGAFVGSIILDPKNGFASGFERGFDVYNAGFHRQKTGERREASMQRRGEVTLGHVLEWLGQQQGGPFFLWFHLWDAHDPYNPPEPFRSRFPNAPYNGAIAYVDDTVGKLLDYLRSQGLYDNAVIAVAADHGESLGEHGELTHSIFLYDATIHVPLLLKLPGNRSAGQRVDAAASLVDLAPTLLNSMEKTAPPAMQGRSLLPLIGNPHPENRPSFATGDHSERSFGWSALVSLRTGNQLYVRAPKPELYDLASDPRREACNLYPGNRAAAVRLAIQLDSFVKRISTGAPQALQDGLDEKSAREKLSALGYVASGKTGPPTGIDPKDPHRCGQRYARCQLGHRRGKGSHRHPAAAARGGQRPANPGGAVLPGIAYSGRATLPKPFLPCAKPSSSGRMR